MTAYLAWSTPPETGPGDVHMGPIIDWLRDELPEDAILTNGAGNYATWVHRYVRFRNFATQAAPASGSMGYGVPAAVAPSRPSPTALVVAFAGDGCFMMHGQEFATAIQHKLPIIVIVVNNSMYGTIRMHQERDYPGRVSATELTNPDFAASPAPMAAMARPWRRPRTLPRPSSGHGPPARRRSSRSSSTSRQSPRRGRWPRSRAPV
jgi:acetolactate synthase-1/2/3 large subunit